MGLIDVLWGLAIFVAGILYPAGWEMVRNHHFKGAQLSFWVGALVLIGVEVMWATYTDLPLAGRLAISIFVGAIALVGLTESLRYVTRAEASVGGGAGQPRSGGDGTPSSGPTVHGNNSGVVAGVVNIYNAPVTQVIETKPSKPVETAMSDRPNVTVTNSPGSIVAPSGGKNSVTNNYGPVARNLDSAWGAPVKAKILSELPRDKPITVTALMGDAESMQLALQILAFLNANHFKTTQTTAVDQSIFTGPVKGLLVQPDGDGLNFIVGANTP